MSDSENTTGGCSAVLSSAGFGGWWQLAWTRCRGNPNGTGGAITHAMNNDGAIACGRLLKGADTGAASDEAEEVMPSCKQCRRKIEQARAALTQNAALTGDGPRARRPVE